MRRYTLSDLLANRLFVFLLILATTFIAYSNAIQSDFIGDDLSKIQFNDFLPQGWLSTVTGFLSDRPVLMTSIWLNYLLSGTHTASYKILSLLFHAGVGFLIFLLFTELTADKSYRTRWIGLMAACLFVIHPLNNQTINSIIQRGVILSTFFALLTFIFFIRYLRHEKRELLYLSYLMFLFAVLSKTNVLLAPIGFMLYQRLIYPKQDIKKSLCVFGGYFAILLIPSLYFLITGVNEQFENLPWFGYFLTQLKVTLLYLKLFFLPKNLRFYYPNDVGLDFSELLPWVYVAIHGALLAGTYYLWRSKRKIAFLLAVFCYLGFLPESSFFPINHVAFEHRTYFPILFLLLLIASLIKDSSIRLRYLTIATFSVAIGFIFINMSRNEEIDNYLKWSLNTSSYLPIDHDFNYYQLEKFMNMNPTDGLSFAKALTSQAPDNELYAGFKKIFTYITDPKEKSEKTLDEIKTILIQPDHIFHWAARRSFNQFYIQNIGSYHKDFDATMKIDDLIYPQLAAIRQAQTQYMWLIQVYLKNLILIKGHYEKNGIKDRESADRYVRALTILKDLYKVVSEEYFMEKTDNIQLKQ